MCIIIDTNTLHCVFSRSSKEHIEFLPVLNWIASGSGMIVYGGSKYLDELKNTTKYLRLFNELNKCNKTYRADTATVDSEQLEVDKIYRHRKFNDSHLAAIVRVTKCKIICTMDKTSIPHLKNAYLYPRGIDRPIFYTSHNNEDILNEKNIAQCCKPCVKMKKEVMKNFVLLLN